MSQYHLDITRPADRPLPVALTVVQDASEGDGETQSLNVPGPHQVHLQYGFDGASGLFATVSLNGRMVEDYIGGGMSSGDLLELAEEWGFTLPAEHQLAIALDLPF
jgi:hypothetical protein